MEILSRTVIDMVQPGATEGVNFFDSGKYKNLLVFTFNASAIWLQALYDPTFDGIFY